MTHEPDTPLAAMASDALILVVDDIATNRQMLGTLLRKAGYQVVSAANAPQAVVQTNLRVPDLILMDIMMPNIDGYTLSRRLLEDPRTRAVPIIFLSSITDGAAKAKAFELGGADYVTKPFQAEEVLARVAHQIKIARLQQALEREKAELARQHELLLRSQQQTAAVFSALSERLTGSVLDNKYRIEEKIGSGGYGAVYRASHLGLERQVALKVFRPPPGAQAIALERFRIEGVSACRVNHPNAVAVLDSGISSEGIAYLVMELLFGPTLFEEMQQRGKLSVLRCRQVMVALCDVLAVAHAAGIIHRDIKPDAETLRFLDGDDPADRSLERFWNDSVGRSRQRRTETPRSAGQARTVREAKNRSRCRRW